MELLKVLYDQTLVWLYRWAAIKNNELRAVGSCVELQSGLEAGGSRPDGLSTFCYSLILLRDSFGHYQHLFLHPRG